MKHARPLSTLLLWCAAALSGGAALAYEVLWSRALVVPLGNSTDATALVMAGFMLGIAAGARLGGGLAQRSLHPLRLYALFELCLAVCAAIAPLLIAALSRIPAIALVTGSVPAGLVLRYLSAFCFVAITCLPMGASLPLLVRALADSGQVGPHIGILYGFNTAGAATGAFLTGFWAIASMGVARSSIAAAVLGVLAAVIALAASALRTQPLSESVTAAGPESSGSSAPAWPALAAAFVSGMSMLACEMIWSRLLTFVFGHDTYAFSTLLALVLTGLALGGLAHRFLVRRDPNHVLALLLAGFSVTACLSFWAAAALVIRGGRDPFSLEATGTFATTLRLEVWRELLYTPVLVLLPSMFAGAAFPAACHAYAGGSSDGARKVGIVGLVNGVGSTIGSLVGAFGLVSLAGIQGSILVASAAAALCASAILLVGKRRSLRTLLLSASPAMAAAVVAIAMPRALPRSMLHRVLGERHWDLLHYEEGRTGTVSVIRNRINGEKQLVMNAVNEVTTRLVHDQSFKLLGHLGPLLHPNPKRVVMICLGAGMSAGAVATHPIDRLDVIDLSSAIPRGARLFTPENNGVLDDPVFKLHIDDGRQFLLNSPGGYDVAVVDSTHPKSVDSWILYTREFFELLRDRLSPGGIVVQWLPLHGMSENEFKIVVRTFQAAFPEMTLWVNAGFETYGQVGYAKLVGVRGGTLSIDFPQLRDRLAAERIRRDLAPFGMAEPQEVIDLYLAGPAELRQWTDGLPIQTDDHPILPYTTRHSTGRRMVPSLLLGAWSPLDPLFRAAPSAQERARIDDWREAAGLVIAGDLERAAALLPEGRKLKLFQAQTTTTRPYYEQLVILCHDQPDRLFEAAAQLGSLGSPEAALDVYQRALALRPRDIRLQLNHALLLADRGDTEQAIRSLTRLRAEYPGSSVILHDLGAVLLASGDAAAASRHFDEALAWEPELAGALFASAQALIDTGMLDRAEARATRLLELQPWHDGAADLLGLVASRRGDHQRALLMHRRAVAMNRFHAPYHYNLGVASQALGQWDEAERAYRLALRYRPGHAGSSNNLGLVLAARGRLQDAAEQYLQALDSDPRHAAAAHNLGVALKAQGRGDDALQAFCLALRLSPSSGETRSRIAELGKGTSDCEPQATP